MDNITFKMSSVMDIVAKVQKIGQTESTMARHHDGRSLEKRMQES